MTSLLSYFKVLITWWRNSYRNSHRFYKPLVNYKSSVSAKTTSRKSFQSPWNIATDSLKKMEYIILLKVENEAWTVLLKLKGLLGPLPEARPIPAHLKKQARAARRETPNDWFPWTVLQMCTGSLLQNLLLLPIPCTPNPQTTNLRKTRGQPRLPWNPMNLPKHLWIIQGPRTMTKKGLWSSPRPPNLKDLAATNQLSPPQLLFYLKRPWPDKSCKAWGKIGRRAEATHFPWWTLSFKIALVVKAPEWIMTPKGTKIIVQCSTDFHILRCPEWTLKIWFKSCTRL